MVTFPQNVSSVQEGPEEGEGQSGEARCSFEEAMTVFGDLLARIFDDEEHSEDEKREIIGALDPTTSRSGELHMR